MTDVNAQQAGDGQSGSAQAGAVRSDSPQIHAAAEFVVQHAGVLPSIAVTLGSGQGRLIDAVDVVWSLPYEELPGGRLPTAIGHAGRLTCGRLDGRLVLFLEGRTHLYEGVVPEETTRSVCLLQRLGVSTLILTNAAGGLNPEYRVGDVVVLDDCLDLTFARFPTAALDPPLGRAPAPPLGSPFDAELIEQAIAAGRRGGLRIQRGVYAAVKGPNYETRAEWRAFRRFGADVIGMSTAAEARCATRLGLRVLGLSTVTNCCRPDAPEITDGHSVLTAAQQAVHAIQTVITAIGHQSSETSG